MHVFTSELVDLKIVRTLGTVGPTMGQVWIVGIHTPDPDDGSRVQQVKNT